MLSGALGDKKSNPPAHERYLCRLYLAADECCTGQDITCERHKVLEKALDDGTWAGLLLWDAAMYLSDQLMVDPRMASLVQGKRILELGCFLSPPQPGHRNLTLQCKVWPGTSWLCVCQVSFSLII